MVVQTERRDRTLIVRMARPEKRNAVDRAMADALEAAFNELEDDDDLWVGILTGSDTAFSAGTDLHEGRSPATPRGGQYGIIRRQRTKPLIAAVEGLALGGGFEMVLACDLVVASDTAYFGLPECKRGVIPTCGGLFRTARTLPLNVARELLLTGDNLDAARAERLGLVNRLVPAGTVVDAAVQLAERICHNAPVSVRQSLVAVDAATAGDDRQLWATSDACSEIVLTSDDAREGVRAFFAKRSPTWSGR
ncbi:MAG: enoyl-CoA hydratase-related protein [Acidimicrobiia bacterium]|nr:enoyl-CoA hydratase-related protein [Acidimicrobiia bacterium]